MEKEALISNLKAKVGENDFALISERTLDSLIEPFLPSFADDEKVTDETYDLPVRMLKNYAGQYRHDIKDGISRGVAENKTAWETEQKTAQEKAIADAIAKAKKEWEKANDNNPPANKSEEGNDLDKKISDAISKALGGLTGDEGAIGKLSKQFSDYMAAQAAKEKAAIVANAKSNLTEFLEGLGADKAKVIELAISEIEIGDAPNMADLQKQAKAKYEALYKDLYGDGGKPFSGGFGGGGTSSSTSALQDFLKEQARKDAAEAANAEAMAKFLK